MGKSVYNVVSLLLGAVGLDIGLEKTGRFQCWLAFEEVPAFCDTIRANKAAGATFPATAAISDSDQSTSTLCMS